jgi:fucose permease
VGDERRRAAGDSDLPAVSVQTTLGQDYLPNRVGTAPGVTLGLAIAAGGALAPGFGVIADHFGLHTALAALLVMAPIALFITLHLPERQDILPMATQARTSS